MRGFWSTVHSTGKFSLVLDSIPSLGGTVAAVFGRSSMTFRNKKQHSRVAHRSPKKKGCEIVLGIFFWAGLGIFFGFLGRYHLLSVCNGLELEFVILHGICHIWACSPSILHGIYLLHVGMFTFHFVWYLPHFGMFTFHFAWDVLHVSMFTQIFTIYRCGSLGLDKKQVGGLREGASYLSS